MSDSANCKAIYALVSVLRNKKRCCYEAILYANECIALRTSCTNSLGCMPPHNLNCIPPRMLNCVPIIKEVVCNIGFIKGRKTVNLAK